jgi:phosphohistidine phosphatase SixA
VERRPDLPTRRALALGFPLIPLLAAARRDPPSLQTADAPPKRTWASTAILLRHAEKATGGDPKDPSLSEAGVKRAKALAALLARSRATHLFATEFKRTQETLAPLAEATKVALTVVPGGKTAELAAKILDLPPGSVAVVSGHSNTIPALATLLGGALTGTEPSPQGPMLPDAEYGRIFVVTPGPILAAGKASVLELAY